MVLIFSLLLGRRHNTIVINFDLIAIKGVGDATAGQTAVGRVGRDGLRLCRPPHGEAARMPAPAGVDDAGDAGDAQGRQEPQQFGARTRAHLRQPMLHR